MIGRFLIFFQPLTFAPHCKDAVLFHKFLRETVSAKSSTVIQFIDITSYLYIYGKNMTRDIFDIIVTVSYVISFIKTGYREDSEDCLWLKFVWVRQNKYYYFKVTVI